MANTKNIIIVAGSIVAIFIAYNLFSSPDTLSPLEQEDEKIVDPEIYNVLKEVQSIKLDPAIFSDPIFNSLIDFSQDIKEEPVGKQNIFARENIGENEAETNANTPQAQDIQEQGSTPNTQYGVSEDDIDKAASQPVSGDNY